MIAYIIKFVLCSGFLYSFYKVFLERESMYKINRFYLLLALIFALIAPLYKMELPITEAEAQLSPELIAYLLANPQLVSQETGFTWKEALEWIYPLVGLGLATRFILNIVAIFYRIKHDEKYELDDLTIVLDQQSKQPFSFLHFIFLPKENYQDIHPNLIQHEKAHCIQKHSWDILFIEIYQIIFWFNPFVYLYKKSIQLNHEFLADDYVLQNDVDLKTYQHQIVDCIATSSQHTVASHFNFILTKKRLVMMTKNTSKRKIGLLSFASLPFLLSAFVLFSQKSFAQEVHQSAKSIDKVLDKKVENPIQELKNIAIDPDISSENHTTITLDSTNKRIIFPKEIKEIPKGAIKNFTIDYKTETGKVELHSGETKEFKLENIAERKKNITIENADQLNNIDPKEIKSIVVGKDRNFIQVIKKTNDTIKFKVNSSFTPSDAREITVDQLKTNELLTENVKSKLKAIYPKGINSYEIYKKNDTKIVKINEKEYVLTDDLEVLKELSKEDREKKLNIQPESTKEKNPWNITIQPHHGKLSVESKYISADEPVN